MYTLNLVTDSQRCIFRPQANDEVQEIGTVETDRGAPVNGGYLQFTIVLLQFVDSQFQVFFRRRVAAKLEIDVNHQSGRTPRSIKTPTSFEPRMAPGLLTRTLTHATSNSSRIIPAIRSASVSTS